MKNFKVISVCSALLFLSACGGGGGGGSSSGPSPSPLPAPNPVSVGTGVNIGNVSTIPVGTGGGSTSAIVTNNFPSQVLLTGATYTLYNASGAGTPHDATSSGGPVNTSLCSSIQAFGTCSLGLSVPAAANPNEGQYLVTMNFINTTTGETATTSQLISYSAAVPINNRGIQVSTINNSIYNLPGASTTYSVPFILTQAINNLTATSQYNNPAFAPVIRCVGEAPYPAGTTCTLFIKISQTGNATTINGNVTVSGEVALSSKLHGKSIGVQGATGYLFNVPVTVSQNSTGNLVTSAINVIVNPANGTSPQTITLLNNGNGTITGINITPGTPTVIGSNTCSSLAIGASCTFTVNATLTQNAQSSVTVSYSSNGTTNTLAFNVVYLVTASTAGLSMTTSGNLNNTVVNSTNSINVTVTNTGTATLNNITFTPQSAFPESMTYGSNASCATDGSQSLSAGQSCTLTIQYSPLSTSNGPTFTIRETATYIDQSGSTASYTAAYLDISYTAINGQAFVYISPNYVAYGIRADGVDTATQTFTIANAGAIETTVNPSSLANPSVTAYTVTGTTGACSTFPASFNLTSGESCTITARFGPTTSTISTSSQMLSTYITSGSSTATAFSTLSFTSSPAALVSILSMTQSGTTGGDGKLNSTPFTFSNSPAATPIQFTITYQNTGTQTAESFNVALNTLPVGYYKSGGTCSTGASASALATNGSCTVIFSAESTALFNSYSLNSSINFNFPGFSYKDASTGLNTNTAPTLTGFPTSTVYVTPTALATVTESTPASWTTGGAGGTNTLTFLGGSGTPSSTRVTILNTSSFSPSITFGTGSGGGAGYCIITTTNGNCTIPVTNLAGLPLTTVYFFYLVAPDSIPGSGITQSGSFTYTN